MSPIRGMGLQALHIAGERLTRLVTLPLTVSGAAAVLPAANEAVAPVAESVLDKDDKTIS